MVTVNCKVEYREFYHGSCSLANISTKLLPPSMTDVLSEKGRNKNLDSVFFTADIGLAKIYAGRAARSIGGIPKLYRVVQPVDVVCLSDTTGATVYHANYAFVEEIIC